MLLYVFVCVSVCLSVCVCVCVCECMCACLPVGGAGQVMGRMAGSSNASV